MAPTAEVSLRAKWLDNASPGIDRTRTAYERFVRTVQSSGAAMSSALSGAYRWLTSIQGVLAGAGLAVGLHQVIGAMIELGTQMEGYEVTLRVLLKSQGLANKALAMFNEFANSTTFQLPEVIDAGKRLIAFGFALENINGLLRDSGDLAAAFQAPITEVVAILGRLKAGDFGEALEQLRRFGIGREQLQQQGIKFSAGNQALAEPTVLLEAVRRLIREKFGDMQKEMAKTMTGIVSMVSDSWGRILMVINNAGVFDIVKEQLKGVLKALEDFRVSGQATNVGANLKQFLIDTLPFLELLGKGLKYTTAALLYLIQYGLWPFYRLLSMAAQGWVLIFDELETQVKNMAGWMDYWIGGALGKMGLVQAMQSRSVTRPAPSVSAVPLGPEIPKTAPDTTKAEAAIKALDVAMKSFGLTTRGDASEALAQYNRLVKAGTLNAEQLTQAQKKVVDVWVASGQSIDKLPAKLKAATLAQIEEKAAAIQAAKAFKVKSDRLQENADFLEGMRKKNKQNADDVHEQMIQAIADWDDLQKKMDKEAEDHLKEEKEEQITRILLFFDADVTRVKTATDLAVFSLGQVATALSNMSTKLAFVKNVSEGAAKGYASGGVMGAIAGAAVPVLGGVLSLFSAAAQKAAEATKRLTSAMDAYRDASGRLADLQGRTDKQRVEDARKAVEDARREGQKWIDNWAKWQRDITKDGLKAADTTGQKNARAAALEAETKIKNAEIALIEAQTAAIRAESQARADNLATLDMSLKFSGADTQQKLAEYMQLLPQYLKGEIDERRAFAGQIYDLNRDILKEQMDAEIKALEDATKIKIDAINAASQKEQDALNARFDMEKSLLRERLAASFNIQSQALRLQFAEKIGAYRGNQAMQAQIMGDYQEKADRLSASQESTIAAEMARLTQKNQQAQAEIEAQRDARIAAVEAAKAERIEAFQASMEEALYQIAQGLNGRLDLGLNLPAPQRSGGAGVVQAGSGGATGSSSLNEARMVIENGGVQITVIPKGGSVEDLLAAFEDARIQRAVLTTTQRAVRRAGGVERALVE